MNGKQEWLPLRCWHLVKLRNPTQCYGEESKITLGLSIHIPTTSFQRGRKQVSELSSGVCSVLNAYKESIVQFKLERK